MKLRKLLVGLLIAGIALQSAVFSAAASAETAEATPEVVTYNSGENTFTFTYISAEEAAQIRKELKAARKKPQSSSVTLLESYDASYSSDYYYSQLTGTAKAFYDALETAVRKFALNPTDTGKSFCEVSFNGVKEDDVFHLYQMFYYSNPQYFFLDQGGRWSGTAFFPSINDDYMEAAKLTKAAEELEEATTEFFSGITLDPTAVDRSADVLAISKKLADEITYVKAAHNQSVIGALIDHQCVCNGYTMAVTYLCNFKGIPAVGISSDTHAWNAVQIKNEANSKPHWFLVDVTWMDQKTWINYKWFGKSTATFFKNDSNFSHVPNYSIYDGFAELPECELDMTIKNETDITWDTSEILPTPDRPVVPTSEDVVWVNGKDFKETETSAAQTYKTMAFEHTGLFSGGKWQVAVTPTEIDTVDEFIKLFEDGKLTKDGKDIVKQAEAKAKAKISEGTVTVVSGKESGYIQVWIYEVKKSADTKKNYIVNENGIAPAHKMINVRMAPSSLTLGEPEDGESGKLKDDAKGVSKLTLYYKKGAETQDTTVLSILDKKSKVDSKNYTAAEKGDEGVIKRSVTTNLLRITPLKAGKTTITITNLQSGKTAKLAVTVVDAYPVTFDEGVTVSYKSGKDTTEVKNGDYVPVKAVLEVTAPSGKTLTVTGGTLNKGKVTVENAAIKITAA